MTTPQVTFYRRILVATGGAPHSERAVERAMALAAHFGAVLDVVAVVPTSRGALAALAASIPGGANLEEQIAQNAHNVRADHLERVLARAREAGLEVHGHLHHANKTADLILAVAAETQADLIVLGCRHTTALSASVAGSVGSSVSHASRVDVLTVH